MTAERRGSVPSFQLWLWLLVAMGYAVLYGASLSNGLAPRPMRLLYGYEPWSRLPPPPESFLSAPPILFDEVVQFAAWQDFTRKELLSGRIPLWNPFQFCGAPHLAASQPGVFAPLNLLSLLPGAAPPHLARLLGFEIAATGAYAWLALQGLAGAACCLGGLCFAFCGFLTLWAGHPHFQSAIWLPCLLLGIDRMRAQPLEFSLVRLPRGFGLVAVSMALSLLGGHVETSFHLALAGALYALPNVRLLLSFGGAVALGAGLAAIQLVPFLEYLSLSASWLQRQSGFDAMRALPLEGLVNLLSPTFWGGEPFGAFRLPTGNLNELAGGFVGVLPLGLALCSVRTSFQRRSWLLCGTSLLLAFEPGPLHQIVSSLPLLGVSYNGRMLLVVALMLSALAAVGLDRVLQGSRPWSLPFLAALAAMAIVVPGTTPFSRLCLLFGFGLVHLLVKYPSRAALAGLFLCAMAPSLELARDYHGGAPREAFWPRLPWLQELAEQARDRFLGLGWQALPPELSTVYGLRDVRGYDAMGPRRLQEIITRVEPWASHENRLGIFKLRALGQWNGSLFDFLGVRRIYVDRGMRVPENATPIGGGFWSVPGTGRARFVSRVFWVADDQAALDYLASDRFDPNIPALLGKAQTDVSPARGVIHWALDEPDRIRLETESDGPGWILLADTDYPGWNCELDGQPTAGLRANYAFRAVAIPAGRHQVEWSYQPGSFRVGLGVSSLLAGMMIIRGVCRDRRRRSERC